jgi:hypothetical protein
MEQTDYLSATEIAEALDGSPSGDEWICRCPNPLHRDSSPSFSIRDGDKGRPVFHCFGGCEQDDLIDALRAEGLWPERGERRAGDKPKATAGKTPPNVKWAREAWNKSRVIDPARPHPYFLARGIDTTRFAFLHNTLRIDPEAKHKASDTIGPAVIALVTDLAGNGVGVQRTFLADGEAAKLKGSAIRIGSPRTSRVLVSEGLEDAMTARAAMDFKFVAWAGAGLSMMDAIAFPDDVTEVVILTDNDQPGRKAARKAAQRFLAAGKTVLVAYPPDGVKDFNELVSGKSGDDLAAGYAAVREAIEAAAAKPNEEKPAEEMSEADQEAIRLLATGDTEAFLLAVKTDPSVVFLAEAVAGLKRLRGVDPRAFEKLRSALKRAGARVSALDTLIAEAAALDEEPRAGAGQALKFETIELWPEPVDGEVLLSDISNSIGRYMIVEGTA